MQYYARDQLIEQMKQIALLSGNFTLRSGKTSSWYFDKYRFEGIPSIMRSVAHHMARLIPPGIDRLAGIELGGIPMCTALSLETDLPSMFIRKKAKEYGTAAQIEGVYDKTDKILVVEDVVTTGGQAIIMINQLREEGLDITGVVAVLNRNEGSTEAFEAENIPFWSLFSREDFGF
ncbi:orotate phosphoribosyltransferase [bacterium]|nr:orotate phosphoribosyltransferase [bacterium]